MFVPGPTTLDQKTKRTTLRKSRVKTQRFHRGISLFYSAYSEHVLEVDTFFFFVSKNKSWKIAAELNGK